jgi:hypothetical protein
MLQENEIPRVNPQNEVFVFINQEYDDKFIKNLDFTSFYFMLVCENNSFSNEFEAETQCGVTVFSLH